MIFVAYVMLAATEAAPATLPAITLDCRRDEIGNCLPIEPSPLAKLLREEHDQAVAIYRPYWGCYWEALVTHKEFGTATPRRAMQVFAYAKHTCTGQRTSADTKMDALLSPLTVYGDDAHKRIVRDYFRSSEGDAFLEQAGLVAGKHDAYAKMREAYQQFELRQIDDAKGH